MTSPTPSITHIAANDILLGNRRLRQRCAWCGAILIDYDLTQISTPVEPGKEPGTPGTFEIGRLVRISGTSPKVSEVLEQTDTLPDDCCGRIDDEVTSQ